MVNQAKKVQVAFRDFMTRVVIGITLDIVANLTDSPLRGGTPVDTGWARSNWIPYIGAGSLVPADSREDVSTSSQLAGIATISTVYRLKAGIISINNNVPYIGQLNAGTSTQAPRGFIQTAIRKAITVDLRAKASLR